MFQTLSRILKKVDLLEYYQYKQVYPIIFAVKPEITPSYCLRHSANHIQLIQFYQNESLMNRQLP